MITKFNTYIKENVSSDDILYAFDLDDTLVFSKSFEEQVKHLVKETRDPDTILVDELKKVNKTISDLKIEDGKIYFIDSDIDIENNSTWIRKRNRVYLRHPYSYSYSHFSLPIYKNDEMIKLYNSVKNTVIITARNERLRDKIENILEKFGIKKPKYGLFMFNDKYSNKYIYKSERILEIYNKEDFEYVNYYDDDIKLLKKMKTYLADKDIKINFYKVEKNSYRQI